MSQPLDDADAMAWQVSNMMSERSLTLRNRRSETSVLDELRLMAWALREFAAAQKTKERARCAGIARDFGVDVSATAKDFARAIAEAIETDTEPQP